MCILVVAEIFLKRTVFMAKFPLSPFCFDVAVIVVRTICSGRNQRHTMDTVTVLQVFVHRSILTNIDNS